MLDHNPLGNKGLKSIVFGLRKSSSLETLSLSYCQLEEESSHYIQ